ncbi:MAG TPA: glycosyltransferase family 2 protein [Feifaniaceae bacterium]|nr:glycosyltransferase family 2 protein [Feifaniaceae bacterium]
MYFSILVPIYNAETYLEECLESALKQTERDFELILVDDGSSDGSGVICDRYAAEFPERVRVVHQNNRGLILARRAGVAAASGDYCVFLDADDTIAPDTLETVKKTIEREKADVVIYNFYNRYLPDETLDMATPVFADGTVFRGEGKRKLYETIISSWRLNNIWSKAIRTPLVKNDDTPFEQYAFNPHMEDLLQSLYPITHADCVVYLSKPLYYYRRNFQGISGNVVAGQIERQFSEPVMKQLERYMAVWGMDTPGDRVRLNIRKIKKMLTVFYQHYRAAKTHRQRREVAAIRWGDYIDWEGQTVVGFRALSVSQRVQLGAVLNRRLWLLDLLARFGQFKLKRLHGD